MIEFGILIKGKEPPDLLSGIRIVNGLSSETLFVSFVFVISIFPFNFL